MSAFARYANDAKGLTRVKGLSNNAVYVNEGTRAVTRNNKDHPRGWRDTGGLYKGVLGRDERKSESRWKVAFEKSAK